MTRLAKKWPSHLEETWCLLSFMLLPPSMRYLRALKQGITINTNHVIAHDQIRFDTSTIQTIRDVFQNCTSSQNGLKLFMSSLTPSYWVFLRRRLCLMCHCYTQFDPFSNYQMSNHRPSVRHLLAAAVLISSEITTVHWSPSCLAMFVHRVVIVSVLLLYIDSACPPFVVIFTYCTGEMTFNDVGKTLVMKLFMYVKGDMQRFFTEFTKK